jgi:tetratricopeptide (TPR) repeat protein
VTVDEQPQLSASGETDDDRWHLEDERAFLQRSLDDADRELEAGDLSSDDHAVLVARDAARLAEVEAELAALEPGPSPEPAADEGAPAPLAGTERRPLSAWRRAGIVASCLLIALGAGILVVHYVQARQPGQPSSGSVTLSQAQQIEQQLQQALALNNQGQTKQALVLYDKVLSEDPSNPAALAYAGWLQWNIGTSAHVSSLQRVGRAEIERAVHVAPSYGEGHLFDGLVLENQDHDHAAAVAQFNDFLADAPPAAELAQVAPLVAPSYQAIGQPLPAAFSTTTSTSSP